MARPEPPPIRSWYACGACVELGMHRTTGRVTGLGMWSWSAVAGHSQAHRNPLCSKVDSAYSISGVVLVRAMRTTARLCSRRLRSSGSQGEGGPVMLWYNVFRLRAVTVFGRS